MRLYQKCYHILAQCVSFFCCCFFFQNSFYSNNSQSLAIRLSCVTCLKNSIEGAAQGIRYVLNDVTRLIGKLCNDKDARVRVALFDVILLASHYCNENNQHLAIFIPLIKKQLTVGQTNVRYAFSTLFGKLLAHSIPADVEQAKRERRRKEQEKEGNSNKKDDKSGGGDSNDNQSVIASFDQMNIFGNNNDDSAQFAKKIVDFDSAFAAARSCFNKC